MSHLKNYLSWFNLCNRKYGQMVKQLLLLFFYVDSPCMKCEESCRILKIIYHGLIYAIGNMDSWQNIIFFYVNIPCIKCEESCHILKIIYHDLISTIGNMEGWKTFFFKLTFLA